MTQRNDACCSLGYKCACSLLNINTGKVLNKWLNSLFVNFENSKVIHCPGAGTETDLLYVSEESIGGWRCRGQDGHSGKTIRHATRPKRM